MGMTLKQYLEDRGESQSAFARRAGVLQSRVNDACNSKPVSRKLAPVISRATGGAVTRTALCWPEAEAPQAPEAEAPQAPEAEAPQSEGAQS